MITGEALPGEFSWLVAVSKGKRDATRASLQLTNGSHSISAQMVKIIGYV